MKISGFRYLSARKVQLQTVIFKDLKTTEKNESITLVIHLETSMHSITTFENVLLQIGIGDSLAVF